MQTEIARAKINLTLHVGRFIANQSDPYYGYHPLDSLVVFADVADELSCVPADESGLSVSGPFAKETPTDGENLIFQAYDAVCLADANVPPLMFSLVKNLPVAAGIGGGSANAAAALRLLEKHATLNQAQWADIALRLGADVPVCTFSQTSRMTGIGETVTPIQGLGEMHAVLVNPGIAVETRAIFRALDKASPKDTPRPQLHDGDLLTRTLDGRNDLEPIAAAHAPEISDVLRGLASQIGCQIARMSGSGATCFGIFDTQTSALKAADSIAAQYPHWWVQSTRLGDAL